MKAIVELPGDPVAAADVETPGTSDPLPLDPEFLAWLQELL